MATSTNPNLRMWGRFDHMLDEKGRIIVPLRFRDKLGDDVVITTGAGNHIRIYPIQIWDSMESHFTSVDLEDEFDENTILLQRMFGSCEFASPDQQNRLSIPRHLRDWAGIRDGDAPAVVLGSGNRVEIWSRAAWDEYSRGITAENAARAFRHHAGITSNAGRPDSGSQDVDETDSSVTQAASAHPQAQL